MGITFDTGFLRRLTLTAQESQNKNLLRAPAGNRERLHTHRTHADGEKRTLATVENNFQRRKRLQFDPLDVKALRLGRQRRPSAASL